MQTRISPSRVMAPSSVCFFGGMVDEIECDDGVVLVNERV